MSHVRLTIPFGSVMGSVMTMSYDTHHDTNHDTHIFLPYHVINLKQSDLRLYERTRETLKKYKFCPY